MKIPIKHAIESGAWFKCEANYFSNHYTFRFRTLAFEKINIHEIDEPHKMKLDDGALWLLKIEFVNLNVEEILPPYVRNLIIVVDYEDYIFHPVGDLHLISLSQFAQKSGLERFATVIGNINLRPKIKTTGALAYLLPDDDAEYFISVPGGNIQEV